MGMTVVEAAILKERERCVAICEGLALASRMLPNVGWTEKERSMVIAACEWLAGEIRNPARTLHGRTAAL